MRSDGQTGLYSDAARTSVFNRRVGVSEKSVFDVCREIYSCVLYILLWGLLNRLKVSMDNEGCLLCFHNLN